MIGICTPYDHRETTLLALRLAELAMPHMDVKLLASSPIVRGVHPYWDRHVHAAGGKGVYDWARGCKQLIWFEHQPELLSAAELVNAQVPSLLVISWHDSNSFRRLPGWGVYQKLICPCRAVYEHTVRHLDEFFGRVERPPAIFCGWDGGITPVARRPEEAVRGRLYVPMDAVTIDEAGPYTLNVLQEALEAFPWIKVTLACAKSWPRLERRRLLALGEHFPQRFYVTYRPNALERVNHFHQHGWTFLPNFRANSAVVMLQSLACGTPVLAHEVPPFTHTPEGSGVQLIPCEQGQSLSTGAPLADPRVSRTLATLKTAFSHPTPDWPCSSLELRAEAFEKFWRHQWHELWPS